MVRGQRPQMTTIKKKIITEPKYGKKSHSRICRMYIVEFILEYVVKFVRCC